MATTYLLEVFLGEAENIAHEMYDLCPLVLGG